MGVIHEQSFSVQDLSTIGPKRYESKPVAVKSGKKKGGGSEGTPGGGGGGAFGLKRRADTDPDYTIGGMVVKKTKLLASQCHYNYVYHVLLYYHYSVIEESATSKIHGYPLEHPFNKVNTLLYKAEKLSIHLSVSSYVYVHNFVSVKYSHTHIHIHVCTVYVLLGLL